MKKVLFALLLIASVSYAQTIDTVLTSDTPNEGRVKINAMMQKVYGFPVDTNGISSMTRPILVLQGDTIWVVKDGTADGSTAGRIMFKATSDSLGNFGNMYVPLSLASSGTGNYATSIQTALTLAGTAGGGVVTLPNGVYGISATMEIHSNTILEGNGATLKLTGIPSTEGVLRNNMYGSVLASRDSNITVRNLTIDVDSVVNTQNPGTNSFMFVKTDHLTIENCNNYDNRNYGFYFLNCSDVKLLNCRSRNVDSPYEFRAGTHNVQIVNCSITLGSYAGLGLYIWENSYDFNVVNFNVVGGGAASGAIAFRVSDSWNVNVSNMTVDMNGSENVPIDLVTKNIGTPDLTIMNPWAVKHNVENVHISNSVFKTKGVAVAAYAMSQSDSLFLNNVRFSNCTFERSDTASVDHRLIAISQQSNGLAFIGCKFIFRPINSSDLFIVLNPDEMVIENCTFQTYSTASQSVRIVEPWKMRMSGNYFGDSLYFATEARSDSLTRHADGNYYNTYADNIFTSAVNGVMNLQVEVNSVISGNRFLHLDSASLATTRPLIIGIYSERVLVKDNYFRNATLTDNGSNNVYVNNWMGDKPYGTISQSKKHTIDTLIVGRDKGYQWFGPRTRLEVADTARIDTAVNSYRNISETAGRMAGDDVGLLTSLTKISSGTDWQSTAMRQSFVVDDAFRTGATSSTWIDYAPYRLRVGVDGTMKYDFRKNGATFKQDSTIFEGTRIKAASIPFYANKSAARSAGLTSGMFYMTVTAATDTILAIIP